MRVKIPTKTQVARTVTVVEPEEITVPAVTETYMEEIADPESWERTIMAEKTRVVVPEHKETIQVEKQKTVYDTVDTEKIVSFDDTKYEYEIDSSGFFVYEKKIKSKKVFDGTKFKSAAYEERKAVEIYNMNLCTIETNDGTKVEK